MAQHNARTNIWKELLSRKEFSRTSTRRQDFAEEVPENRKSTQKESTRFPKRFQDHRRQPEASTTRNKQRIIMLGIISEPQGATKEID